MGVLLLYPKTCKKIEPRKNKKLMYVSCKGNKLSECQHNYKALSLAPFLLAASGSSYGFINLTSIESCLQRECLFLL